MALKLTNNAVSRFASAITDSQTSFSVTPGEGARFPAMGAGDWFPLTGVKPDGSVEIMKCTGRSGDVLTVTRAQEGTTALAFDASDRIELRLTVAVLNYFFSPDNMGSSSGLDADTLDGFEGASGNTPSTVVLRDGSGNSNHNVVTANSFVGPVTGNTSGTHTGPVTGDVTGNVSGNAGTATTATNQSGGTVDATNAHATVYTENAKAVLAENIDVIQGNHFTKTISGATTFTVSNVPAAPKVASFTLKLVNGGSAAVTWWAGVKWAGGTAPTLTAAGTDILRFMTDDGGTTWYGFVIGQDMQ